VHSWGASAALTPEAGKTDARIEPWGFVGGAMHGGAPPYTGDVGATNYLGSKWRETTARGGWARGPDDLDLRPRPFCHWIWPTHHRTATPKTPAPVRAVTLGSFRAWVRSVLVWPVGRTVAGRGLQEWAAGGEECCLVISFVLGLFPASPRCPRQSPNGGAGPDHAGCGCSDRIRIRVGDVLGRPSSPRGRGREV